MRKFSRNTNFKVKQKEGHTDGERLELSAQALWRTPRLCSRCARPNAVKLEVRPILLGSGLVWGCTRCFRTPRGEPRLPTNPRKRRAAVEALGQATLFSGATIERRERKG